MSSAFRTSYDVIVIGGRVAGAATALQLARAGASVLMIDRARPGSDTVSTHALMRGGVVLLQRWGLLPALQASGTPAVRKTTFHYGDEIVPVEIKTRDGVDALYAPRRTVLDVVLAEAAERAGVDVHMGTKLVDLEYDASGTVVGVAVDDGHGVTRVGARLVIGADGIRSTVARLVNAPESDSRASASGTVYGYWPELDVDGYHWYYAEGVSGGAVPTTGSETCVFVAVPEKRFRDDMRLDLGASFHRVLAEVAPELAARLGRRPPSGSLHAFPGAPGHIRQSHGPGWALVGDAGFFRDPLTAHGITDALRDSNLLVEAYLRRGEPGLADYAREREPWAREMLDVTDAIASFDWSLDSLKPLHQRLSKLMARESEMIHWRGIGSRPVAIDADRVPRSQADDLTSREPAANSWAVVSDTP